MPTIEVVFLPSFLVIGESIPPHTQRIRSQVLPIKASEAHLTTEGCQH